MNHNHLRYMGVVKRWEITNLEHKQNYKHLLSQWKEARDETDRYAFFPPQTVCISASASASD